MARLSICRADVKLLVLYGDVNETCKANLKVDDIVQTTVRGLFPQGGM